MSRQLLQHYIKLTEFLGHALGPDYEVALHDLTDKNRGIIAIANNHVSGREVGAPLTNIALKTLMDRSYETSDYKVHSQGITVDGKKIRSSTLFIKNGDKLLGLLCINFDDSRYLAINEHILQLCHPNAFVETNFTSNELILSSMKSNDKENLYRSLDVVTSDVIEKVIKTMGYEKGNLILEEKIELVRKLDKEGIFLVKGAIKEVSLALNCSQATVYRYLSQIKHD